MPWWEKHSPLAKLVPLRKDSLIDSPGSAVWIRCAAHMSEAMVSSGAPTKPFLYFKRGLGLRIVFLFLGSRSHVHPDCWWCDGGTVFRTEHVRINLKAFWWSQWHEWLYSGTQFSNPSGGTKVPIRGSLISILVRQHHRVSENLTFGQLMLNAQGKTLALFQEVTAT